MTKTRFADVPYETLFRMYITEQQTCTQIARTFGVHHKSVLRWLKRRDIPIRSNSEAQLLSRGLDQRLIHDLYVVQGLRSGEIEKRTGMKKGSVVNLVRRNGWKTHGLSNSGSDNGMFGRTHTEKSRERIRAANKRQFASIETRKRHGALTAQAIREGKHRIKETSIERTMKLMLQSLGVEFIQQYVLGRFAYDFRVGDLLIECDGTFWHADPRVYGSKPLSKVQKRNVLNDRLKNKCARNNTFRLLRIWEYDINSAPEDVLEQVKAALCVH